jgi:type IV secretory pathway TraG/TraD family ATPase VirD4
VGVPLIHPEHVKRLSKWRQIIIMAAMDSPIKARLVPYFKRRKWRTMTDKILIVK